MWVLTVKQYGQSRVRLQHRKSNVLTKKKWRNVLQRTSTHTIHEAKCANLIFLNFPTKAKWGINQTANEEIYTVEYHTTYKVQRTFESCTRVFKGAF